LGVILTQVESPMIRALVIHYHPGDAAELAARLRRDGFEPDVYPVVGSAGLGRIRDNPPDVAVIDLMRMPSYGRAMGALLRQQKSTRGIPLVFIQGDPGKTRLVRKLLPDAVFTSIARLAPSIEKAVAAPPREPLLPDPARIPAAGKLRIREGNTICLVNAPPGFRTHLNPLPKAVRFQTSPADADIILLFVKSSAQLGRELPRFATGIEPGRALWVLWPKKTSGVATDLTMPRIIEFCSTMALSIGRLCAVDKTWSALGISPRRR
jgi:CheY-like chemotaxis protein